jgi:hypothetical protein
MKASSYQRWHLDGRGPVPAFWIAWIDDEAFEKGHAEPFSAGCKVNAILDQIAMSGLHSHLKKGLQGQPSIEYIVTDAWADERSGVAVLKDPIIASRVQRLRYDTPGILILDIENASGTDVFTEFTTLLDAVLGQVQNAQDGNRHAKVAGVMFFSKRLYSPKDAFGSWASGVLGGIENVKAFQKDAGGVTAIRGAISDVLKRYGHQAV